MEYLPDTAGGPLSVDLAGSLFYICVAYDSCRIQNFVGGDLKKINHFEDLGVDGRLILKYSFKM
jgi:hypothetical protein